MSVVAGVAAAVEVSIEAVDLTHWYAPGRGLAPVSFAATSPGVIAITGRNGAGKSTLLRILAGLLRPSAGCATIVVQGTGVAPSERRRWIGFAGPDLAFYDELTVTENLVFAAEARALTGARAAVEFGLERVGLAERRDDRVAALSSGMKQRLGLGFAILARPSLLLLDEPGSHLDEPGRERVRRLIAEQQEHGLVVLATNDEREWALAEQRIELRSRGLGDRA